jgi:hypothetical protein
MMRETLCGAGATRGLIAKSIQQGGNVNMHGLVGRTFVRIEVKPVTSMAKDNRHVAPFVLSTPSAKLA